MKYKRIARSRRGLGKRHSLWMGDDHLLAVESTGYSEEYTRYYFKDIQAVVTRRTARGTVVNAISGTAFLISLFAGLAAFGADGEPGPGTFTAGIFGGFFLILLLWNLFRGPACRCFFRSSVGVEELPALDRLRSVKKVLARLRPLISQLQGEISRNEIAELVRTVPPAASPAAQVAKPPTLAKQLNPENATSSYRGAIHRVAFLFLIAEGVLCTLKLFHNSKTLVTLSCVMGFAFLLLGVIALIKQKNHSVSPLAGKMAWGGIATQWVGSVLGYIFIVFLNFGKFKNGIYRQNEILDLYAAIEPADHLPFAIFLLVYAVVAVCIGITGLIAIGKGQGLAGRRQL